MKDTKSAVEDWMSTLKPPEDPKPQRLPRAYAVGWPAQVEGWVDPSQPLKMRWQFQIVAASLQGARRAVLRRFQEVAAPVPAGLQLAEWAPPAPRTRPHLAPGNEWAHAAAGSLGIIAGAIGLAGMAMYMRRGKK